MPGRRGTVAGNAPARLITYQLYIRVPRRVPITPGRLGTHVLARGWYVYTGSARRNMAARLRHHLDGNDTRRWHIDWLLGPGLGEVMHIRLETEPECLVNARVYGHIVIPRFGATDCRHRCGSHLLFVGTRRPPAVPRDPAGRRTYAVLTRVERAGVAA